VILYSLGESVSGRNVSHSEPHFHSEASILPLTVLFLPLFLVFRTVVTFTQLRVTCRGAVMSIVYEEDVVGRCCQFCARRLIHVSYERVAIVD
jgi:hypothetical protein